MKHIGVALLCAGSLSIVACGGDPNNADGDTADGDISDDDSADDSNDADDGMTPDAPPMAGDWQTLVGRTWTVPAGSADTYKCIRIQVPTDMWITGFRAIAPTGTHHTVVTMKASSATTGEYDCGVSSVDPQMLYASGVGTEEMMFPNGVGMKIRGGTYINLNLHLFNASDTDISGESGVQVKLIDQSAVQHEADMFFAGTMQLNIPADGQPHDVVGGCETRRDLSIFALWPHMHQFATHQKVELTEPGAAIETLLDDPYSFEEQRNYPMAPRVIPSGSQIKVTCTYVNNGTQPITWGDSSNQEMCFTGMYRYPAGGTLYDCVGQP